MKTQTEENNYEHDSSIVKFIANITNSKIEAKSHELGNKIFINIETADRKLSVNKKFQFCVYYEVLLT